MDALARTTDILRDLIGFPTVSSDSNTGIIAYLAERLEDAGARATVLLDETGQKANLFATIGPEADGGIVLSGHSDVVPVTGQSWTSDPFKMVARDGRLYGRGTCDMKGFIAAAVAKAAEYAALNPRRPVHFAFTHDEEVGCIGAQALCKWLATQEVRPSVAIIGEPTEMAVIEGHKGCCEYQTHFQGLAGHGSAPDRGVNAVDYAVRYIGRLLEIADELKASAPEGSRFDPPWTTINTGALHGGETPNVIPETATVMWEFRPVQDSDFAYVKTEIEAYARDVLLPRMRATHPGAAITVETLGEVVGLEPAALNEARDILLELTGANGADVVPFGTEAGLFRALGLSAVVCGPGSIAQAHKPDEFVEIAQLDRCLTMLTRLEGRLI